MAVTGQKGTALQERTHGFQYHTRAGVTCTAPDSRAISPTGHIIACKVGMALGRKA
jgi:hypothetical protein